LSATTEDVGEAVLRPPGWHTDVVLDQPAEMVAEVVPTASGGHGALGLIAEPTPSTDDDAIRAAVGPRPAPTSLWWSSGSPRSRRPRPSTRGHWHSRAGRTTSVKVQTVTTGTREDGDHVIVTAEVGGGGYNGPATFTFSLAPGGEVIQRMTISG
jgi:hypothetical protein